MSNDSNEWFGWFRFMFMFILIILMYLCVCWLGGRGGGSGGGGETKPGNWTCPGCGVNCFASKDTCFKCGGSKPDGGGGGWDNWDKKDQDGWKKNPDRHPPFPEYKKSPGE